MWHLLVCDLTPVLPFTLSNLEIYTHFNSAHFRLFVFVLYLLLLIVFITFLGPVCAFRPETLTTKITLTLTFISGEGLCGFTLFRLWWWVEL